MKALWIVLAVLGGGFIFIMVVGSTLPDNNASVARRNCDNLRRTAYTAAEKAQADEICAMIRKEADRRDGRLVQGAP